MDPIIKTARGNQPADGRSGSLLSGLGRAQLATLPRQRMGVAATTLMRAFDSFVATGEVVNAAAVFERSLPPVDTLPDEFVQVMEQALELAPPDSHQTGHILPNYGIILGGAAPG